MTYTATPHDPWAPTLLDPATVAAAVLDQNRINANQADAHARLTDLESAPTPATLADVDAAVTAAKDELLGGVDGSADTLKEIADHLADSDDAVGALVATLAGKASAEDVEDLADRVTALEARRDIVVVADLEDLDPVPAPGTVILVVPEP